MAQSSRRMWSLVGVVATVGLSAAMMTSAATATEAVDKAPPIVGGEPASIADHPWTVYLADDRGNQLCGGTLASVDKVVTAAHCVQGAAPADIRVVANREDTTTDAGTVARVTEVWVHPEFQRPEAGADVAVLTVDQELTQSPLALAAQQDTDLYAPGTKAKVLGWGATMEGGASSDVLRKATVPIVSDEDCSAAYGSQYVPEAMVCAGLSEGGVDACQGDSGGPLVVDGKLVGIVSFGNGCARPDNPGVYTRVSTYHDDIQAELGS